MKRFVLFALLCVIAAVVVQAVFGGQGSLGRVLVLALVLASLSFLFGAATGDYSWIDRLWSIAPVAFAWIFAVEGGGRSLVAALLISLWGIRLTFNFARRGGYAGMEDYRWSALRSRIEHPLAWQAFNLLFIAGFQMAVLVLISVPVRGLAEGAGSGLGAAFWAASLLALGFLLWEGLADQQQWSFQNRKAAARAALERGEGLSVSAAEELERGFCEQGLFRLSRHPNYFGELGFWWSIWLLGVLGGASAATVFGPLLLTAVFVGSTRLTEELSAAKYPAYRGYQGRVPAVLPRLPVTRGEGRPLAAPPEPATRGLAKFRKGGYKG